MKLYLLSRVLLIIVFCLAFEVVFAQDATQEPLSSGVRPPLVPCVEGAKIPCVQNVDQIGAIVGTWRSYIRDNSGVHFGFTVYKDDGSIAVTSDLQAEPTVVGNITFAKGVATITTLNNSTDSSNCVGAGNYEVRLIHMGNQPVAVTYHPTESVSDVCFGRVGGYVQPIIYYSGTGKDLNELQPSSDALTQSIVPCMGLPRPCDVVATKADDIKGFWKTYFTVTPEGIAFWRANEAGGMMMTGNGDDLSKLKEFFPAPSPNNFNGAFVLAGDNTTGADDCGGSIDFLRVIKFGDQQVALVWTAIQDKCAPRNDSFSDAMIWSGSN